MAVRYLAKFRALINKIGLSKIQQRPYFRYSTAPSFDERTKLLRRVKVLIVEIDMLIMSDLKQDGQEASSSPPPDQSGVDV